VTAPGTIAHRNDGRGGPIRPAPAAIAGGRASPAGRWRAQLAAWCFCVPVAAYLLLFYAYPLYRNLDLSLRNYTVRSFVQGGAPFTGLANYRRVTSDPTFLPALGHTVVFTVVSIVIQFGLGLALAVFFQRHFRLSAILRALFLVPWLLPLIVSASTWSWLLNSESGVINSVLHGLGISPVHWLTAPGWSLASVTIANIWIGIPFNLVILYSGLQAIPVDIMEAAALDGATAWQSFRLITLPLLRPVSAITVLLGFIYTLKVFDIIWVMTRGGPSDSSTTFATWSYRLGFGNLLPAFGPGAAVGNLLIVIAVALGLLYIRVQRRQEAA
jgi:multiple sugar transport system permease protein